MTPPKMTSGPLQEGSCSFVHPSISALSIETGLLQMEGPSPLLPAWLDFWLQPSRAAWNRGLKSGASPLLLPPRSITHSQEGPADDAQYPVSASLVHAPQKAAFKK